MQHIISGDGVRPELEETWDGEEEACRFADGTRWGERAGDPSYRPVNWPTILTKIVSPMSGEAASPKRAS